MADGVQFEQFVRTHATDLMRAAVLLTGSAATGEDLLQDTLTHLLPRWDKVAAADVPVAYVRRVLTNRYVSAGRSPWRRDVSVWDVPERWADQDVSETIVTRAVIWQALGGLTARQRAAIVLRYFYDQPDAEIARVLECREVTVRSLVSRGTGALRAALTADSIKDRTGSW